MNPRTRDRVRLKEAKKLMKQPAGEWETVDLSARPHPEWMTRAYKNNRYVVMVEDAAVTPFLPGQRLAKVMIQRHDNTPIPNHWREIQNIKNELFGEEVVGVEFYPPQSQLKDEKNIYWLWLLNVYNHDEEQVVADPGEVLVENIARVCHEVNRAYCQALGDHSHPTWESAPDWQRDSAQLGVRLHMSGDHGPEASHESWMQQKVDDGWVHGEVKDPIEKTHPCIVPFDQLPVDQQAKDFIFRAVVHALND